MWYLDYVIGNRFSLFIINVIQMKKLFIFTLMSLFAMTGFCQEESYKAPKDEIFQGTSVPGFPVEGNGWGGWRSGTGGVAYYGNSPRPEYEKLDLKNFCKGTAVDKGLVPPFKPALELHLRDGVVTLGGDVIIISLALLVIIYGLGLMGLNYGNLLIYISGSM